MKVSQFDTRAVFMASDVLCSELLFLMRNFQRYCWHISSSSFIGEHQSVDRSLNFFSSFFRIRLSFEQCNFFSSIWATGRHTAFVNLRYQAFLWFFSWTCTNLVGFRMRKYDFFIRNREDYWHVAFRPVILNVVFEWTPFFVRVSASRVSYCLVLGIAFLFHRVHGWN